MHGKRSLYALGLILALAFVLLRGGSIANAQMPPLGGTLTLVASSTNVEVGVPVTVTCRNVLDVGSTMDVGGCYLKLTAGNVADVTNLQITPGTGFTLVNANTVGTNLSVAAGELVQTSPKATGDNPIDYLKFTFTPVAPGTYTFTTVDLNAAQSLQTAFWGDAAKFVFPVKTVSITVDPVTLLGRFVHDQNFSGNDPTGAEPNVNGGVVQLKQGATVLQTFTISLPAQPFWLFEINTPGSYTLQAIGPNSQWASTVSGGWTKSVTVPPSQLTGLDFFGSNTLNTSGGLVANSRYVFNGVSTQLTFAPDGGGTNTVANLTTGTGGTFATTVVPNVVGQEQLRVVGSAGQAWTTAYKANTTPNPAVADSWGSVKVCANTIDPNGSNQTNLSTVSGLAGNFLSTTYPNPIGTFVGPESLSQGISDYYAPCTGTNPAPAALPGVMRSASTSTAAMAEIVGEIVESHPMDSTLDIRVTSVPPADTVAIVVDLDGTNGSIWGMEPVVPTGWTLMLNSIRLSPRHHGREWAMIFVREHTNGPSTPVVLTNEVFARAHSNQACPPVAVIGDDHPASEVAGQGVDFTTAVRFIPHTNCTPAVPAPLYETFLPLANR